MYTFFERGHGITHSITLERQTLNQIFGHGCKVAVTDNMNASSGAV
jgi:hypothetical protein